MALLSQEGSTIETAVEIVRGWFHRFGFQECILKYFLEGTTPRVIAERDDAALLTQEGNRSLSLSSSARQLIWTPQATL
jgi:hypothetical protein